MIVWAGWWAGWSCCCVCACVFPQNDLEVGVVVSGCGDDCAKVVTSVEQLKRKTTVRVHACLSLHICTQLINKRNNDILIAAPFV